MQNSTKKIIQELDEAIAKQDFDTFEKIVEKLTPNQLIDYSKTLDCQVDLQYMLWSTSKTWGFEFSWATLARMSPEEIEALKAEIPYMDTKVLDYIAPDKPFGQICKWAPQDQLRQLYLQI